MAGDEIRTRRTICLRRSVMGAFCLLATLLFLATACTGGKGAPGGEGTVTGPVVLRLAITREPQSLDPAKIRTLEERLFCQALYAGLLRYDPSTGELKPALADRWECSPDGRVYTFHLHPATFFSNRSITAADVKYSLGRLLDPGLRSPWAFLLRNVAGADQYARGQARDLTGIILLDPSTLQIVLGQPQPDFLYALAHPAAAVVDRLMVEAAGAGFGQPGQAAQSLAAAGGSGPFALVEWAKGRFLTLENNPCYPGSSTSLTRVEAFFEDTEGAYQSFQAGEVDLAYGFDSSLWKEAAANRSLERCRRSFPLEGAVSLLWPAKKAVLNQGAGAAGVLNRAALAAILAGLAEPLPDRDGVVRAPAEGSGRVEEPPVEAGRPAPPESLPVGPAPPGQPAFRPGLSLLQEGEPGAALRDQPQATLKLLYPEAGAGSYLLPEDMRLLAEGVAGQLTHGLGIKVKTRAVAGIPEELAGQAREPLLLSALAPYRGAGYKRLQSGAPGTADRTTAPGGEAAGGQSGTRQQVIPLLKPVLAVLVGERVSGLDISPWGDLDWTALKIETRISGSQDRHN